MAPVGPAGPEGPLKPRSPKQTEYIAVVFVALKVTHRLQPYCFIKVDNHYSMNGYNVTNLVVLAAPVRLVALVHPAVPAVRDCQPGPANLQVHAHQAVLQVLAVPGSPFRLGVLLVPRDPTMSAWYHLSLRTSQNNVL